MPNINCLVDFKCECGSLGPFEIEAVTTATVYDSGVDETEGCEWTDNSHCRCSACGKTGTVRDFKHSEA